LDGATTRLSLRGVDPGDARIIDVLTVGGVDFGRGVGLSPQVAPAVDRAAETAANLLRGPLRP